MQKWIDLQWDKFWIMILVIMRERTQSSIAIWMSRFFEEEDNVQYHPENIDTSNKSDEKVAGAEAAPATGFAVTRVTDVK